VRRLRRSSGSGGSRGGRRRNYAPAATGARKFVPTGWANWLGVALFGFVCATMIAEAIVAAADGRGADPIAAALFAALTGWLAYLFATGPRQD
jgi:hypothetical protein